MSGTNIMGTTTGSHEKQESQSVEWKWSWQDEFLKWLCGYTNTDGGTLYIGVNDDGFVVGVENAKSLLEGLPNKITDKLGVIPSVKNLSAKQGTNIRYGDDVPESIAKKLVNQYTCGLISSSDLPETDGRYKALLNMEEKTPLWADDDGMMEYIEIYVPQYPFAISCEGKYYKRSGSTLRELNGFELQNFLLERAGMTWDGVPLPNLKVEDLSARALDAFRSKSVSKERMKETQVSVSNKTLMENLKLLTKDGNLIRAAALMFHPDPEEYATGAYIKIGYFAPEGAYGQNKVNDLIYDDTIHGPLMTQVDDVIDILYTKYLKALISYDGLQRIETYMWPREAFREVLLNAINHKSYEKGIPIQIKAYDDKIIIWNDGKWPDELDVDKVYEQHPSIPRNPKIADVFFRSGEVESWGSGFSKIKIECDKYNAPYPIIKANPHGGVELQCNACDLYMKLLRYGRYYDTYPQVDDGQIVDANNEPEDKRSAFSDEERKSVDRMMEILSRELSDKEKKKLLPIVKYLQANNMVTRQKAEELTQRSLSTATRYLNRLVELDVLYTEGQSILTIYRRK